MFLPTTIASVEYEDGDMVSPVPIRIARQLGATRVVAVDVSAFLEDTPDRAPESWRQRDAERRTIIDSEANDADYLFRVRLPYYAGASREYRENLIRLATAQTTSILPAASLPCCAPGDTLNKSSRVVSLFWANYFVESTRNSPLLLYFSPGISSQNKARFIVSLYSASPWLLRAHTPASPSSAATSPLQPFSGRQIVLEPGIEKLGG